MEFFSIYSEGYVAVTGGPDTDATRDSIPDSMSFYCAKLTQKDHAWRNGYVYVASDSAGTGVVLTGLQRPIAAFTRKNSEIKVAYPFPEALEVGAHIEIHEMWAPHEIHNAINKSIRLGSRVFSEITEDDKTFCIADEMLEYDLSDLHQPPRRIFSVWVEQVATELSGTVDSGSSTYLEVAAWAGELSDADTDWILSIYDGTGKGRCRSVASVDNDSGGVTLTADTYLALGAIVGSKVKLWDRNKQVYDWIPLTIGRTNKREFPDYFRLTRNYPEHLGRRIRIVYAADPGALTSDSQTTKVNEDFIVHKSLSILHDSLVGDNRFNQNKHANLAEYHDQLAAGILRDFMRRLPQRQMMHQTHPAPSVSPSDNPLGW